MKGEPKPSTFTPVLYNNFEKIFVWRPHFNSFYFENIRVREDVNKYACRLLSESGTQIDELMYLVRSLLRRTPARPIGTPGHGPCGGIGGLTPYC